MSGLYDDRDAMLAAMGLFFQGHPDLPKLPEVWDPIADYIFDRKLTPTLANFEFAYQAVHKEVELAINRIPSDEWKRRVVIPAFKARQAAQPKPTESRVPWGVKSYTSWLHDQ